MKLFLNKSGLKKRSSHSNPKLNMTLTFLAMFIFGLLFLMIGYTQNFVQFLIWPAANDPARKYISLLLLPQILGFIIGTSLMGKLVSKMNIRYIYMASFGLAGLASLIIAFLDKFGLNGASQIIPVYCILTFLFGIGVGPVSPLVVMYVSAQYDNDADRNRMLSYVNATYGIGAGIIPLAFSGFIVNITTGSNLSFDNGRYFYIIAAIISFIGAACTFMINFKHSAQLTSSTILEQGPAANQKTNQMTKKMIWKPLLLFIFIMMAYTTIETSINFSFANFANKSTAAISEKQLSINVIRAFGLYVCIIGLWRLFSGLFLLHRVKYPVFIALSTVVIFLGLIGIFAGALNKVYGIYLEAVAFGFGIGNLYPTIYSYSVSLDAKRATFIGRWISIGQTIGEFFAQLFIGLLWINAFNANTSSVNFFAPIIFITCVVVLLFSTILITMGYVRHSRQKLEAESNVKDSAEAAAKYNQSN